MDLFIIPPKPSPLPEFWIYPEKLELKENPEKLANQERCNSIVRELSDVWEIETHINSVAGGERIDLRFFAVPFPPGLNQLLGELIARSNEFYPMPDAKDPAYMIFSMTVYGHDRIRDGRLLPD